MTINLSKKINRIYLVQATEYDMHTHVQFGDLTWMDFCN
jgi:hypothetical protein